MPFTIESIDVGNHYNPRAPHRHNYHEIFLFEAGGGIHMIDFVELEIGTGEVHLLSPGQIHYMHRKPECAGWVLKFTPEFFLYNQSDKEFLNRLPFLDNRFNRPVIKPGESDMQLMLNWTQNIREEVKDQRSGYQDMIRNYLNLILLKCHRNYDYNNQSEISEGQQLYDQLKTLVNQYFIKERKVGFYADALHVSEHSLNKAVQEVVGESVHDLITNKLLLEAKRYLLHSPLSVKELSHLLNFEDNSYFNRWFKKLEQQSPGAFRSKNREKYHY